MKKFLSLIAIVGCISLITACDDNSKSDSNATGDAIDTELKAIVEQYVPGVIYEIYGNLADESELLYEQLLSMKESDSYTQSQIDQVCETFLSARKWWEQSEAFLYGAATIYGIDPHIDSWPLDKDKLARSLSNSETIENLDKEGAGAVDEVGAASLGFHGIEFILFRDGANRTVAALTGVEDDDAFTGRGVTGATELIFATAVAEDLRNYCFELQAAWDPDCPEARFELVEELELNTLMSSGLTYGENLLETGNAGSTYRNWQEAVTTILIAGCSNISDEVANTKIGSAHYVYSEGYDPDYIESPYSKKSYQDFKDNMLSIQYSIYGSEGATTPLTHSIYTFLLNNGWDQTSDLKTAMEEAITSLDEAMAKGAFVDDPTSDEAENCIVKINELDALINEAADWISKL